jgi:outer membrane receptor protein involved in Fe transport
MQAHFKMFALLLLLATPGFLWAQSVITGSVKDAQSGDPLIGVNIVVKGKVVGTVSDLKGNFTFKYSENPPFALVFSMVGYESQEIEINNAQQKVEVALAEKAILGQEVVIAASRIEESMLQSPVAIEKMDILAIRETPSPSFFDGLANLKGVDMITSSLGFKVVNSRGFNDPSNTRFIQLVDGIDNAAPSLNFPVANFVGLSDLDVESVEMLPGAASALYGTAAFNGALLMTSKNPFLYQGLSAQVKTGVNHIDGKAANPSPYFNADLRYAKSFNDKFAFKINASYLKGEDWHAYNGVDKLGSGGGREVPGYDGLNIYGDEVAINLPLGPNGSNVLVSRTGYAEKDLVDYDVENYKADASLHYRINNNLEASYTFKYGGGTTVYTAFQRYSFKNLYMMQHKLELKGSNFFIRGYISGENSNDTYDAGFTGININRRWKSDADWFQEYAGAFLGAVPNVPAGSHDSARAFADRTRLVPGTAEFQQAFDEVTSISNFGTGSKFAVSSQMRHIEGMYNFAERIKFAEVQVGASYRLYDLNSKGTLFPDTTITATGTVNDITYYEVGGFVQASKKMLNDKLKLTASGRVDKSEQIEKARFTPRFSAVYTHNKVHNFRFSYQTAFRMPSSQVQFIDLDLGRITLVGGLPQVYNKYGVNDRNYLVSSAQAFGAKVAQEVAAGKDAGQAAADNFGMLKKYQFGTLKPEGLRSFEVGYKGLFNEKLFIDVAAYYGIYSNFQAARRVLVTANDPAKDPLAAVSDISTGNYKVYGVYDNTDTEVTSYGATAGISYTNNKGYLFQGNYTFADLNLEESDDLIAAFNTPKHKVNFSVGNREVIKNMGFNVTWRWADSFYWNSSFSEGTVPAYSTLDMQVSFKLKNLKSLLKVGGTNVLNQGYTQLYGGPTVGALYYVSLTFDQFMN